MIKLPTLFFTTTEETARRLSQSKPGADGMAAAALAPRAPAADTTERGSIYQFNNNDDDLAILQN